uniref:Uncharacterized protein n=1 Tax=Arundo donax TaxID=35708 RepID=A0A0A9B763_ARUDO
MPNIYCDKDIRMETFCTCFSAFPTEFCLVAIILPFSFIICFSPSIILSIAFTSCFPLRIISLLTKGIASISFTMDSPMFQSCFPEQPSGTHLFLHQPLSIIRNFVLLQGQVRIIRLRAFIYEKDCIQQALFSKTKHIICLSSSP